MNRNNENLVALVMIIIFAATSLLTAHIHVIHYDEPAYADPTVNLLVGKGFTTTAWYSQHGSTFFSGNVPLYQFVLLPWFSIFGIGQIQARLLAVVLQVTGSILIFVTLRRANWVSKPTIRLVILAIVLLGENGYMLTQYGRPDALTFFLAALTIRIVPESRTFWKWTALFLLGMLSALAGLQLVAGWAIVAGIVLLFFRYRFLRESLIFGSGAVVGLLSLIAVYHFFGVYQDFLTAIAPHSATSAFSMNRIRGFFGERSFLFFTIAAALLLAHFLLKDRSELFRSIKTPLSILKAPKESLSQEMLDLLFVSALFVGVPVGLTLVGKFTAPYTWMAILPGAIGCGHLASTRKIGKFTRTSVSILVTLGILVGYPLRGATAICFWNDATCARTEDFVDQIVLPSDEVVYITQVFYPVKIRAKQAYYAERYLPLMSDSEKRSLSLLLIPKERIPEVLLEVGGSWVPTGQELVVHHRRFPMPDTEIRICALRRTPGESIIQTQ